jgi:hypothetical protein
MKYWVATEKVESSERMPGTDGLSQPVFITRNLPNTVYHLVDADGKLLCGISSAWAMKLADTKSSKLLAKRPLQLECCAKCGDAYIRSSAAELRRLRAWNSGKAKMFSSELEAGSKYGKPEPVKKKEQK